MRYTRAMIPDYQTLLRLILECASSGEVGISDVVEQLGNKLGLTADERATCLPGSKQKKFAARVNCAKSYLKLGGLVEITGRSRFSITDRGRSTLADKTAIINNAYLGQFEGFQSFKSKMSNADIPTLWHLDDIKQEIIYCDLVEERYRDASELALRVQVAKALVNKGVAFDRLAQSEGLVELEELAGFSLTCYGLVEDRYWDAPEPALQEQVARALIRKGEELCDLKQRIACYDLLDERYRDAPELALRKQVANALISKGIAFERLDDPKQAIACYDLVDARYGDASEPVLQAIVKEAVAFRAQLTGYSGAS